MDTKETAAPGANRAASSSAFDSRILPLPRWLVSLPTMASCIVSLAAPMAAALTGLIAGGQL